jgi:protocatechuate 3,4-dioxygenase beta subunit
VHASINPNQRLRYSLDSIQVTSAKLGNLSQTFPTRTYDTSLPLPTAATARDSFSISTAVSVVGVNTALFDAALPALAGMQVLAGTTIQPTNVFDGLLNPGWIPAAGGTDTALDTVTFSTDPGWRTGEAVRVIASVGAPANGLVSYSPAAPTTDNALTATVYARRLSSTQFCFNTTEAGALAAATPIDITDAIPTDGTFSFTGGSSDLSFFAQTPLNSLATPSSTDTTTDKVTFDATPLFRTGDAVRVTTIGGGLSPSTTYYIRIDGNQACFYTSAAAALNQVAANPFNLTGNVAGELYLYNRLQFAKSHRWTTGTIIRQGTSGTNLFVRQIDANSITLHANAADAATGANPRVQTSAAGFPITPVFNMFCVDRDRQINSRTYNAQIFSSYSTSQFPDTTLMPKDAFAVHDQAMPASSSLTISSTNTSTRVLTLNSHGLVTGTAVQLATTDASGLSTGVDYFVRELTANTFSLHATRADAEGGGSNALPLAGTVTSKIFPSLSIRFANAGTANAVGDAGRAGTVWSTGTRVQIKASAGGLQANTDYYVRYLGKQLFSFHTSRADAVAGNNPLRITSALDSTNQFQVPERFVECTENLDAVNWLLNTDILNQLSNPVSPVSFTATTLSFTNHSLSNGDRFRVTAATGDLVPGRDYFFRKIDSNTVAVHDTFAAATATTETTAARLTVTDGTGNLLAQIQTCFVWYDVEEAIWSLIEDYSAGFGYGNGTNATGIQRVQEILAMVGAVVPLGDATVSYVPGRGEQLVLITSPYEVDGSGNKFVSAQTMAIQVPVDTIEGYIISNFSTDTFSYSVGATLSGNVFCDCDNDGIQTVDSTPIADVTITLTGTDQLGNAVSLITTTAADGSYLFIGLSPGTYTVSQTQPTGYLDGIDTAGSEGGAAGNDVISNITIGDGVNATEYNFAELHPSSVAGTVYVDSDNDGVVDAGETRLAGVTVKLAGTDDRGQSVSQTATTDANGEYLFDNLRPGTYVLTQTQPADYLDGLETLGTAGGTAGADQFSITIEACTTATGYNFGELVAGSLAGRVFEECDNDGVFNGDAAGLTGVTVTLTGIDDLGNSVSTSMTTDADGRYQFSNLRPGTYTVTETQPAGYLDGTDTVGSEGGTVSNDSISAIGLGVGVNATGYDFAELDPSSLAGVVYVDSNNDGVVDAGETRLAGVTVTLTGTDDRGLSVSQTATTDANGEYLFDNLRPGTYTLTETQPAGYSDGQETLGSAGGTVGNDQFTLTLNPCTAGSGYNFGERENANLLAVGDTATIGFWANKNGQAILRSLNGGPSSTLLAQWLVGNFPNLYGAGTGTRSMLLSGGAFKTNDQVATTYIDAFFKPKATVKLEAQILSAAFATYVTNSGLAGTSNIASRYGFTVSATGTGAKLFSVGSNGAALGVADGTMLSIYDMLVRVNSFAVNGVLYAGNTTLRTKANLLFTAINETGDII